MGSGTLGAGLKGKQSCRGPHPLTHSLQIWKRRHALPLAFTKKAEFGSWVRASGIEMRTEQEGARGHTKADAAYVEVTWLNPGAIDFPENGKQLRLHISIHIQISPPKKDGKQGKLRAQANRGASELSKKAPGFKSSLCSNGCHTILARLLHAAGRASYCYSAQRLGALPLTPRLKTGWEGGTQNCFFRLPFGFPFENGFQNRSVFRVGSLLESNYACWFKKQTFMVLKHCTRNQP